MLIVGIGPIVEIAFNKINRLSAQHEASQCTLDGMPSSYNRVSGTTETFDQPNVLAHVLALSGKVQPSPRYLYGVTDSQWGRLGTETAFSYKDKILCFSSTYTTDSAAIARFKRELETHGKPSRGIVDSISFYRASKISTPELGQESLVTVEALLWDSSFVTGQASAYILLLEEKTIVKIIVTKPLTCSPSNFLCKPDYGLEEAKLVALQIQDRFAPD